jgi:anti-sigma B factor antagonist
VRLPAQLLTAILPLDALDDKEAESEQESAEADQHDQRDVLLVHLPVPFFSTRASKVTPVTRRRKGNTYLSTRVCGLVKADTREAIPYTTPLRSNALNIIKNRVDDVTVLDIQGVIKLGESAREFSSYLEKVLNDETGPVMINFEAINYMDSTGLGELIGYLQKFEDRQRKMALVKPSHRILALLKITKLDTVFKIFDSREAAMEYLTDHAA